VFKKKPKQSGLEREIIGSRSQFIKFVTSEKILKGHRHDVRIVGILQVSLQAGFFVLAPIEKEPF
jgi:hypothetical protein